MAYVDWNDVADALKGEKKLKEILLPHSETAEAHPFLDKLILRASQYADKKLKAAGKATPLDEPLTDEVLSASICGLVVGYATEGDDQRKSIHQKLYDAAIAYFDGLLEDADIVGAEDADSSAWSPILANDPDLPVFDHRDPYSEVNQVFTDFGPPSRRRW